MYTQHKKRGVEIVLCFLTILLVSFSVSAVTSTEGCKLKEGVSFDEEATAWLKMDVDPKKDLYVQEFTPVEDQVISKVDLNLRNYNDEPKSVMLKIRTSVKSQFLSSEDIAASMVTIDKTMTGDWFTFDLLPRPKLEAGKTYYIVMEQNQDLSGVKIAASTGNPYPDNKMLYFDKLTENVYQNTPYDIEYDILFRTFNCGEEIKEAAEENVTDNSSAAEPAPVVEEVQEEIVQQEIITAQATKDVVEEKKQISIMGMISSFVKSSIIKVFAGVLVIIGIAVMSFEFGRRSASPQQPKKPKEKQSSINGYAVGSIEKYKEVPTQSTQQKNDQIFNGRF